MRTNQSRPGIQAHSANHKPTLAEPFHQKLIHASRVSLALRPTHDLANQESQHPGLA